MMLSGPGIMLLSAAIFGYFGFATTWNHNSVIDGSFLLFVALLDWTLKGSAVGFGVAAVLTFVRPVIGNLIYGVVGLVGAFLFVLVAVLDWADHQHTAMHPLLLLLLVALLLPSAAPLLGMLCFGNLMRECGVVDRLSDTTQNSLINIVTIFLGLAVGSKLNAEQFLDWRTLSILLLGLVAFAIGTASGILMGKLLNKLSTTPINPLIGAAGVSAVPMAARVANKVGLEANPQNILLMHALGPNVAGVIGSAVAAGIMIMFAS